MTSQGKKENTFLIHTGFLCTLYLVLLTDLIKGTWMTRLSLVKTKGLKVLSVSTRAAGLSLQQRNERHRTGPRLVAASLPHLLFTCHVLSHPLKTQTGVSYGLLTIST